MLLVDETFVWNSAEELDELEFRRDSEIGIGFIMQEEDVAVVPGICGDDAAAAAIPIDDKFKFILLELDMLFFNKCVFNEFIHSYMNFK